MNSIRLALLSLLCAALFFSCKKEKSFENGYNGNLSAQWEFTEDKQYKGKVDTAFVDDSGVGIKTLFVEGTTDDGKEHLSIQVVGIDLTKPASYKTPAVIFTYIRTGILTYANDVTTANEFTLIITHIDTLSVSGTFTGKVKDSTGALKTVTDGKFTAKLKTSNNPPPPITDGTVTFWAKASCSAGSNIIVKLSNGKSGTITSFSPTEPTTCGMAGTATISMPAGNYSWTAYCGSQDSTSGTLTVLATQCTRVEVSFSALPANCKLSSIGYYFMPGSTLDDAVNSFFTGNQITKIQVYDSASSSIYNDFTVTYSSGKIIFGGDQTFTLNGNGSVAEYDGFVVPFDNTTDSVIVKYEYDGNGYMTKRTLFLRSMPTTPVLEAVYTWIGGNLTRIVNTLAVTNERWETDLEYNLSKTAKSFLNFQFLAYEILQFQTAINTGKVSSNIPVKATTKYFENNVLKSTDVSNFVNYVIDANNYVKSFEITGADYDSYLYWGSEKYALGYKCF